MAGLAALACQPANIDALTDVDVPLLPQNTTTKFVHWGGAQPVGPEELAWFVAHLAEVEATPFDGTVLDLRAGTSLLDGDFAEADFAAQADLLAGASWQRFTENFQRLQLDAPSFGDDLAWEHLSRNVALLAKVAKRAGLRGFLLDTQEYADYHFSYARLPAGGLPFAEVETSAFARGRQLMQAMLAGYPELTVLQTLSTSDVFREVCIAGTTLEQSDYALLPAFVDGMHAGLDEARSGALLIDGFLPAYSTTEPASFRLYHDLIHGDWPAMQAHWLPGVVTYRWAIGTEQQATGETYWPAAPVLLCSEAERQKLTRDFTASFGVMLDYPSQTTGTDIFQVEPSRFAENAHQPADYTALLRSALGASDRYVWSWTSSVVWWQKADESRPLVPAAYVEAAIVAREQAATP